MGGAYRDVESCCNLHLFLLCSFSEKGTIMNKKYLSVDYHDKELAKKLGAKWDSSVNRWYCLEGSALSKVLSWRVASVKLPPSLCHTPVVKKTVEQISLFA